MKLRDVSIDENADWFEQKVNTDAVGEHQLSRGKLAAVISVFRYLGGFFQRHCRVALHPLTVRT